MRGGSIYRTKFPSRLPPLVVLVMVAQAHGGHAQPLSGAAVAVQSEPQLPPALPSAVVTPDVGWREPLQGLVIQGWNQILEQRPAPGDLTSFTDEVRLILDYRRTLRLLPWLDLHLSDRLDAARQVAGRSDVAATGPGTGVDPTVSNGRNVVNAVRESYLTARLGSAAAPFFVDAGRINLRSAVASGFNPTDYFKTDAVVDQTNLDPSVLREDRLGTFMLRGQTFGAWGAATVALVPRLSSQRSQLELLQPVRPFSLLADRTNATTAFWMKVSPAIGRTVSLDMLFYLQQSHSPQLGLDGTILLSPSVVAGVEASMGRSALLPAPDVITPPDEWRLRLASFITWSASRTFSMTIEHDYSGAALSDEDWRRWSRTQVPARLEALGVLTALQSAADDLLVQQQVFMRVAWTSAFSHPGLDISSFASINGFDGSFLWQFSASQALNQTFDLTVQAGGFEGASNTSFGMNTLKHYVSAFVSARF